MRRIALLALLPVLPSLGCDAAEALAPAPVAPSLSLQIQGDRARVKGKVLVRAEASSAEAFRGVAFHLGGATIGEALRPPFTALLDSTSFPDGPATVEATGALVGPGEPIHASLTVELDNLAPTVAILAPKGGAALLGSPSKGFVVNPVVEASDGNGIAKLWAEAGGEPVDLGRGDGTVSVPLTGMSKDFPHPAVPITIHARDKLGSESSAVVHVVPSNVKVRFERPTGSLLVPLRPIDIIEDGRPLLQLGSSVYLLPEPGLEVKPSLSLTSVDKLLRHGNDLFFLSSLEPTGRDFVHATLAGAVETLFTASPAAHEFTSFGPFLHSSGRVFASFQNIDTGDTHLLAYQPDGTPIFDVVHPPQNFLSELAEAPDGRLLAISVPSSATGFIQPLDPKTGATLPPFAPGGGQFQRVDDQGVVILYYGSSTYGTPEIHLAEYSLPEGALAWDHLFDSAWPSVMRRLASGALLVFASGVGAGVPSTLRALGPAGAEVLWTGDLDKNDSMIGALPGKSDMVVARYNTTTSALSAFLLREDGSVGWSLPLPGGPSARMQLLEDGSLGFASAEMAPGSLVFKLIGPDGKERWSKALEATAVLGIAEQDDLLVLPCSRGEMKPFAYEARRRATGELVWRYREGVSPPLFQLQAMRASAPWGVLFAPLILADPDQSTPSYTSVVLGFVP